MSPGFRFALRLAYGRRQAWRQTSVVSAAIVCVLIVLTAIGTCLFVADGRRAIEARSPIWSEPGSPGALQLSARGLVLDDGLQFPIVWLQPNRPCASPYRCVPPGLRSLPGPGEAVLSPGLIGMGYSALSFGLQPSRSGLAQDGRAIGADGVTSQSEAFLYARPGPGRSLGSGGALIDVEGYADSPNRLSLETIPDIPSVRVAIVGSLWLLVIPALATAGLGARAMSTSRDQRNAFLFRLGVSFRRRRLLLAIETLALALPSAVAGALAFAVVSPHVTGIPLSGLRFLPGQFGVPLWLVAACVLVVVAVMVVAADLDLRRRTRQRQSPTDEPRPKAWRFLPLVASCATMAASALVPPGSARGAWLVSLGMLATMPALLLVAGPTSRCVGAVLATRSTGRRWLAGRSLSAFPRANGRPAAMMGLLVFVACSTWAVATQTSTESPSSTPWTIVSWRDPQPTDLPGLARRWTAPVLPITETTEGSREVWIDNCQQLEPVAAILGFPPCAVDGTASKPLLDVLAAAQPATVRAGEPSARTTIGAALLWSAGRSQVDVHEAAAGLPAVNVESSARSVRDPSTDLLYAAGAVGIGTLGFALVREVIDRLIRSLSQDRLARLGVHRNTRRSIARVTLTTPAVACAVLAWGASLIFARFGAGFDITRGDPVGLLAVGLALGAAIYAVLALTIHVSVTP